MVLVGLWWLGRPSISLLSRGLLSGPGVSEAAAAGPLTSPGSERGSLLSHMRAHAWRLTHTHITTPTLIHPHPPRHPCWHFGEKEAPPTPIYLPPTLPSPPHTPSPPVAADVPRSVADHLLPHSTPYPHLLLPPLLTLPNLHPTQTLSPCTDSGIRDLSIAAIKLQVQQCGFGQH